MGGCTYLDRHNKTNSEGTEGAQETEEGKMEREYYERVLKQSKTVMEQLLNIQSKQKDNSKNPQK